MFRALSDRITEDADWREGMNAFRQNALKEIEILKQKIEALERTTNGTI